MKYIIDVTDDDIKTGMRCHCLYCPVAEAIRRKISTPEQTIPPIILWRLIPPPRNVPGPGCLCVITSNHSLEVDTTAVPTVSSSCVCVHEEGIKRVLLPVEVSDRIQVYDKTGEMSPFSFEIDLV
jgi:hypothetical protein